MIKIYRKGRKLPVEVKEDQLGRVVGDNHIWVWFNPEGLPEVVYREEQEVVEPEEE